MRLLFGIALSVAATDQAQSNLTNIAALLVAGGTLAAGIVAYLRLRTDRPKVVAEVAGLAEARLRDELKTSWEAVDRLREREDELDAELVTERAARRALEVRCGELESDKAALTARVSALEALVGGGPANP